MKFDNEKFMVATANSGMMLKDVAKKADISENALRDIRYGKAKPRTSTLGRIAKALNVDVRDIIQEEGE